VCSLGSTSRPTQYRSFRRRPFQAECTQTHNNGTVSLTFTETQKQEKTKKRGWLGVGNCLPPTLGYRKIVEKFSDRKSFFSGNAKIQGCIPLHFGEYESKSGTLSNRNLRCENLQCLSKNCNFLQSLLHFLHTTPLARFLCEKPRPECREHKHTFDYTFKIINILKCLYKVHNYKNNYSKSFCLVRLIGYGSCMYNAYMCTEA